MLKELKFVQGSVAKKDFLPSLTHFCIEGGTVRGFNGTIALCSPLPFDIACKPKAESLVRAIGHCGDTIQLSMTAAGRLSVRSAGFKAFIECVDGDTPHVMPSGSVHSVNGENLLAGLKAVEPFIGEDASRPWANGALLNGPSIFATNNVILVEYWAEKTVPLVVNIPRAAVREIIRINEAPVTVQADEHSLTFHYDGGRWLRTQLLPCDWPDIGRVFNGVECTPVPVPQELFDGLKVIKPFAGKLNQVFFKDGGIQTHGSDEEGAQFGIADFSYTGVYNIDMLERLEGSAAKADFNLYPKPCPFFGGMLRGAIIGMKE